METDCLVAGDRAAVWRGLFPRGVEPGGQFPGIHFLCYASAGLSESKGLFFCQYHVHRKSPQRRRNALLISTKKRPGDTARSCLLLWSNCLVCHWSRRGRALHWVAGLLDDLAIRWTAPDRIYAAVFEFEPINSLPIHLSEKLRCNNFFTYIPC